MVRNVRVVGGCIMAGCFLCLGAVLLEKVPSGHSRGGAVDWEIQNRMPERSSGRTGSVAKRDVAGEAATVTERLFAFFSPKRFPALVTKYINGDIHEQYGVSCGRPRIFL
ncbi:hypothetical protein GCM10011577_35880 [Pseudarthrobacter polychromogenes]|uniref:Secreted protein n=1 Tax=Pseudarthrobacter polychromogenes TaxID=1676 RepID=A0ABQ1Y047_9MICC|nr:hypothetical protein GCM10011577_35880 [Pseudarthrobacter polychromogenes]